MSIKNKKSLSDVLDQISREWVPGASRFFEAHEPDPVATLNEQLEIGIIGVDPEEHSYQIAIQSYEFGMLKILKHYKGIRDVAMGNKIPEPDNRDAFFMGAHDGTTRIDEYYNDKKLAQNEPIRKFF